ncbi:hypothetical protein AAKU64_002210 [Undibacterium sp. GrIS 1.8]
MLLNVPMTQKLWSILQLFYFILTAKLLGVSVGKNQNLLNHWNKNMIVEIFIAV